MYLKSSTNLSEASLSSLSSIVNPSSGYSIFTSSFSLPIPSLTTKKSLWSTLLSQKLILLFLIIFKHSLTVIRFSNKILFCNLASSVSSFLFSSRYAVYFFISSCLCFFFILLLYHWVTKGQTNIETSIAPLVTSWGQESATVVCLE